MRHARLRDTDIAAFIDGSLSDRERLRLERLFAEDPRLFEEFCAVSDAVRAVKAGQIEQARRAPLRLVRKAEALYHAEQGVFDIVLGYVGKALRVLSHAEGIHLPLPGHAAVLRSGGTATPAIAYIRKSFDELDLDLVIERTGAGACSINVSVSGADTDIAYGHLRAEFITDGRVIGSEVLEGGKGTFEAVSPGRYRISLRRNRRTIGDITIRITEPSGGGSHE